MVQTGPIHSGQSLPSQKSLTLLNGEQKQINRV